MVQTLLRVSVSISNAGAVGEVISFAHLMHVQTTGVTGTEVVSTVVTTHRVEGLMREFDDSLRRVSDGLSLTVKTQLAGYLASALPRDAAARPKYIMNDASNNINVPSYF